jgi:cysteine synthase
MVLEAEKDGILIPGKSVVIEPTSGNTGAFLTYLWGFTRPELCMVVSRYRPRPRLRDKGARIATLIIHPDPLARHVGLPSHNHTSR